MILHKLSEFSFRITINLLISCSIFDFLSLLNSNKFCHATSTTAKSSVNGSANSDYPEMLTAPAIIPAEEKQTATIIFIHNYLQTGNDWVREMTRLREPYMKVICPTANRIPIDWYHGKDAISWYNFQTMNDMAYLAENNTGIDNATRYIHHLINKEISSGIPSDRIIVAGLIQGGALALHAGLSYPKRLGGIICISPWTPMKRTLNECFNTANRNVPILQFHHFRDPHSADELFGEVANHIETKISSNHIVKYFTDLAQLLESEFIDIKDFLEENVPPLAPRLN